MLKISAIAALALGLAAAAPAAAQAEGQAAIAVPYADLNLNSEEGRAALDRRLTQAARKVCGGKPDLRQLSAMAKYRDCVAVTTKSYEAQRLAALEAANAKRVAVLADKLGLLAAF
ncbi:MAG: UrcA family protein [Pseudomonadota bacterium]